MHESEARPDEVDAKLVFLARSLQARLMTTDYNLAKLAEFQGVPWLNLHALARSLRAELALGQSVEVQLVKAGKEPGQAVGFFDDGSMIVVADALARVGQVVRVEITGLMPSAGGKLAFAGAETLTASSQTHPRNFGVYSRGGLPQKLPSFPGQ